MKVVLDGLIWGVEAALAAFDVPLVELLCFGLAEVFWSFFALGFELM